MSTDNQNIPEEIDLGLLVKKVNDFFGTISFSIFKGILFVKKNILIFIGLFIIGIVLGFYSDSNNKNYDSEIIVSPSGGGVDYLYSKIDLLTSKLVENDAVFFKNIGIVDYKKITQIKIDPIIDLYSFVNNSTSAANAQNTQNFELVKLLSESGDINKVIKDKLTSKNYPYHLIIISTNKKISKEEIIKPILKYLNTDEYLNKITHISKENILIKMNKNEQEIKQLDSLISQISKSIGRNKTSSNLVYNNENNQINGLFDLKNSLINEIASQKIQLVKIESFIKDISITTNIKNTKGTNGKMKLIVPFVFISLFIFLSLFISFYKKQAAKLT